MRYLAVAVILLGVVVSCSAVQAQIYVQPPVVYVPQVVPVVPQVQVVPVQPYLVRRHYWTPVRDFLFGTYRMRFAPIVAQPQTPR